MRQRRRALGARRGALERRNTGLALVGSALLALLAAGCFGGSAGKAGAGETRPIVLTLASTIRGGPPEQLIAFASEVEERSRGTVKIRFASNWRPGDVEQEPKMIADVRSGKVDLAWVGARAWDWVGIRSFDALVAPLLIDSHALEQKVFEAGIPARMLPAVAHSGVVPIGVLPGPLRTVLGIGRRLVEPSDFRGQTIGVAGVVAARTIRALGGRPKQQFAQFPLTGLDGIEEQPGAIVGNNHAGPDTYLSAGLELWPRPLVIIAAPRTFSSLTRAQQDALREGAAAAVGSALSASRREDAEAAAILCAQRLAFVGETPADLAAFREAVAPVYAWLKGDPETRRFMAEIEALKSATAVEAPISCTGASAQQEVAATALDGVWEMSVDRVQLEGNPAYDVLNDRSVHHPTEEDIELDVGRYHLSLNKGRFTFGVGPSHDSGVYAVHGDAIVFRIAAGHDAGETWEYRWSLYRGMLTFLPPSDRSRSGPPNPMFTPWHRAGA